MTLYQGNNFVQPWNNFGIDSVVISESYTVTKGKEDKLILLSEWTSTELGYNYRDLLVIRIASL